MSKYINKEDISRVLLGRIAANKICSNNANDCKLFESKYYFDTLLFEDEQIKSLIKELPSADVRPNIHGHWMKDDALSITIDIYKCSICSSISGASHYNFCPKCGADMREPKGEKGTE